MNVGSGLWYQMDLTSATRATNSISLWAMQITKLLASFLKPFPLRFSHCTLWSCPLTDTAATTWWARWWWRWRAWTSPTLRAALSHWSERSPQGIQGWQWEIWVAHIAKEGCTSRNPENKMSKTQERQASKPGERRAPGLALPSGDIWFWFWAFIFQLEKSLIIWCSCSAWCKSDHSCRAQSEKPPKNGHHRSLRWDKLKTLHSILG